MNQNFALGQLFSIYRVFLTMLSSFWGHSVHSDFRQHCISKMAGRRVKWTPKKIWASGGDILVYAGYFSQWSFHGQLLFGEFLIFPIFNNLCRKRLVVEQTDKTWALVLSIISYRALLSSFWGHSVHSDFQQPCISKKPGRRAKRIQNLGLGGKYLVYTGYFWHVNV